MAFIFKSNNYIVNKCTDILFAWKQFMISMPPDGPGWLVVSSSDGISVNLSGDIITNSGSGAGGMYNVNSWFVIQSPTGRQLLFQLTSTPYTFLIGYSKDGLYTGGTSSVKPTATDENIVLNNSQFLEVYKTYYRENYICTMHFGADDSGENSFYIIGTSPFDDEKFAVGGLVMEEITPIDKLNANIDPIIFYIPSCSSNYNYSFKSFIQSTREILTFEARVVSKILEGTSMESFGLLNVLKLNDFGEMMPGYSGKNMYSKKIQASAMIYGMSSGTNSQTFGITKGIGKNMLCCGYKCPTGTIVNVDELGTYVSFRDFLFPFPSNTSCMIS